MLLEPVGIVTAIALWVRGYVLCSGCEKGVHTDCTKPCMCDLPGCGDQA